MTEKKPSMRMRRYSRRIHHVTIGLASMYMCLIASSLKRIKDADEKHSSSSTIPATTSLSTLKITMLSVDTSGDIANNKNTESGFSQKAHHQQQQKTTIQVKDAESKPGDAMDSKPGIAPHIIETPPACTMIVFTHHGDVVDQQLFSIAFARYNNPSYAIVVLSDNAESFQASPLIQTLSVTVFSPDQNSTRTHRVRENYKHSSTNSPEFEIRCITRFLHIEDYITSLNFTVKSIIHLDLDLVVLSPSKPPWPNSTELWTLFPYATYFMRFTPRALVEFNEFICGFYDQPPEQVIELIESFGYTPSGESSQHKIHHHVSHWLAPSIQFTPKQFSDMAIFNGWLKHTDLEIAFKQSASSPSKFPKEDLALVSLRLAFKDVPACSSDGGVFQITWESLSSIAPTASTYKRYNVFLPGSSEPLWGMHFQGSCKKFMCDVLCPHLHLNHSSLIECCSTINLSTASREPVNDAKTPITIP
jgi:hypothetical protein